VAQPKDLVEAYAVQEAFQGLCREHGRGAIAGYKLALTSRIMQDLMGIDHPCIGGIFETTIRRSPATVRAADFVGLGIECEIAVRLGADLGPKDAPYGRESVAAAVAACVPAIELIEDRAADYTTVTALPLIAENAWNGGIVLGQEVADWKALDLENLRGEMAINGQTVGVGHGRDVMGHPFEPLAWLANALIARGKHLREGMVVMTGSIVATQRPKPGDKITVSLEGLGSAAMTVV
jgi:2-oxo-3-hexenedioate decarboxylase/2-keto-4-pentenoate hydratase